MPSIEHDIVHGLQALPSRIEQMLSQDKRIEAAGRATSLISTTRCSWAVAISTQSRWKVH